MHDFQFSFPSTLIFGAGKRRDFISHLQAAGAKRVLLHYGGGSIRRSGLLDMILTELSEAGISCFELGGVQPNPRLSMVRQGVELCRREKIDYILACGGSVIDSAMPHGAGLTVLTPAWMKYIYRRHIPQFAQFAVQVMGVEPLTRSLDETAAIGIRRLEELFRSYGMPTHLAELGITDDSQFEFMAKRAVGFAQDPKGTLGILEPLTWVEIVRIFRLAM